MSRKEFCLDDGMVVEEIISRRADGSVLVTWVLKPFESLTVNGLPNWCYNADCKDREEEIECARFKCAELFCKNHGLDLKRAQAVARINW